MANAVTKESTQETLEALKAHLAVTSDIGQTMALLSWDQHTKMPPQGAEGRAQQMATLSGLIHERVTDERVGRWLGELEPTGFADGSDEAALLREVRRGYEQATKLPADFVEELTKAASISQQVWAEARQNNDFAAFQPSLEKMVELARQQADYLGYDDHPYDALHDQYEPGSTVAEVRKTFAALRDATVPLVKDIVDGRDISDAPVHQMFDEGKQEQLGVEAVKAFGYDFESGRLDRTVHPFATGIGPGDVRITTRYESDFLNPALFGTMHEAGHGMYEQGLPAEHARSPLGESVSLGIHESQSRLWENLVGRSHGFWQHYYPRAQELFPERLGMVSLDRFYAAVNKVEPSLIRVEADEVTYNLHIMIRFELELAMLEGSLKVADIPDAWNAKYEEYLGITPPTDALGCLQDVHWSMGGIGYFPTYTLGNIMSVQLFEAAKKAHPEIDSEISQGKFDTLLSWLRENVYQHGSKYLPQDLLERATGSRLDAKPYINYLNTKFRQLYGLS